MTAADVDVWRRRISLTVAEVQALIESSKFEPHDLDIRALERKTADAQIVLVLLLTLARHQRDPGQSKALRARAREIDDAVAKTLEGLAARVTGGVEPAAPDLEGPLQALDRAIAARGDVPGGASITADRPGPLALYRTLVAAVERLAAEPETPAHAL
jgi:hypothetical protein